MRCDRRLSRNANVLIVQISSDRPRGCVVSFLSGGAPLARGPHPPRRFRIVFLSIRQSFHGPLGRPHWRRWLASISGGARCWLAFYYTGG